MEGISLRPALAGRALGRTQPLFWEHEGNRAVRSGNWKLVSTYPNEWELYDMVADRVERNDLAASRPDLVKTLARGMGRLGQAGERGSLGRPKPAAVGRRRAAGGTGSGDQVERVR